jgi:hypothetical protein
VNYLAAQQARKAGQQTPADKATQAQLLANLQASSPAGLQFLGQAQQNLGAASDFGNSIMRGGYQNMLGVLGPELSAGARGNQAAMMSSMRQMPRGGGTGTQRLGLMDSLGAQRNNALIGMRPTAANMLASLGGTAGSLGSGLLSGANSGGIGMLGYGLQNRQSQFDMSRQSMQGALSALGGIDWGGGGGGGGLPSSGGAVSGQNGMWTPNSSTMKPGTGG